MTTLSVGDRVHATPRNRSWLGTSGGTVTAVDLHGARLQVAWDSGRADRDVAVGEIERTGDQ
jgi:hypothetical protein